MTASVAAMMGGESITTNLYLVRSSAMASASLCEDSRSAGFDGSGPAGEANMHNMFVWTGNECALWTSRFETRGQL